MRCALPESVCGDLAKGAAATGADQGLMGNPIRAVPALENKAPLPAYAYSRASISLVFCCATGVVVEKCLNSPFGLVLPQRQKLSDLPEYRLGYFEIQDESSQLISFKLQVSLPV